MVKPDEVKSSKSLLYISGGNNNSAAPKDADQPIVQIATATKSVATELRMVPNQPLTFSDDKKPRVEDEFIAYTWDKFLKTGDGVVARALADDQGRGARDGHGDLFLRQRGRR